MFRKVLDQAPGGGGVTELDSAGTSDWHVGEPPYGPMMSAAKSRGYDMSALRARQAQASDFERFDLIVAMDASNVQNLEMLRPEGNTTQVRLFTEFAPETGMNEVPDPYYTRDFDAALDLIERCAKGMLAQIKTT